MKEIIVEELKRIEREENLKVLYACESGSRAWGFPSQDSDYDVRFIYVRPLHWYLSIDESRDTLELPLTNDLDINGWDLRKALRLFRGSNAALYEWLQSPIIYWHEDNFLEEIQALMPAYFSLRSGMHHYLSITRKYILNDFGSEEIKLKRLFYALRSVLACKWITEHRQVPPMELGQLTALIKNQEPLMALMARLLVQKANGTEKEVVGDIDLLKTFIEQEANKCQLILDLPTSNSDSYLLNTLLWKWLS